MIKVRFSLRLILCAAVLVADAAAAVVGATFLQDRLDAAELEERRLRNEVTAVRREVTRRREELAELPDVVARYEAIEVAGFLAPQERLPAVRALSAAQGGYAVDPPEFELEPVRRLDLPAPKGHALLATRITLSAAGLLDTELFGYWLEAMTAMPGKVALIGLEVERRAVVTDALLAEIATRGPRPLVSGEIVFDWITLRPEAEVRAAEGPR